MRVHSMIENVRWIKGILVLLTLAMVPIFAVNTASAHKAVIFAWVEGDTIYTESKLSGGKKVKEGDIIVYDLQGNRLLEGKTNEQGEFSFKIPKKTTLKIVLQAGMGHRGEWTLPVEEMGEVTSQQSVQAEIKKTVETGSKKTEKQTQSVSASNLSPDDIQLAFEKALDKKLKPVMKKLAEPQEHGPTVKDILGGIGYILGLVGVASYFHYRRKTKDLSKS
jgi:nickel transport protein